MKNLTLLLAIFLSTVLINNISYAQTSTRPPTVGVWNYNDTTLKITKKGVSFVLGDGTKVIINDITFNENGSATALGPDGPINFSVMSGQLTIVEPNGEVNTAAKGPANPITSFTNPNPGTSTTSTTNSNPQPTGQSGTATAPQTNTNTTNGTSVPSGFTPPSGPSGTVNGTANGNDNLNAPIKEEPQTQPKPNAPSLPPSDQGGAGSGNMVNLPTVPSSNPNLPTGLTPPTSVPGGSFGMGNSGFQPPSDTQNIAAPPATNNNQPSSPTSVPGGSFGMGNSGFQPPSDTQNIAAPPAQNYSQPSSPMSVPGGSFGMGNSGFQPPSDTQNIAAPPAQNYSQPSSPMSVPGGSFGGSIESGSNGVGSAIGAPPSNTNGLPPSNSGFVNTTPPSGNPSGNLPDIIQLPAQPSTNSVSVPTRPNTTRPGTMTSNSQPNMGNTLPSAPGGPSYPAPPSFPQPPTSPPTLGAPITPPTNPAVGPVGGVAITGAAGAAGNALPAVQPPPVAPSSIGRSAETESTNYARGIKLDAGQIDPITGELSTPTKNNTGNNKKANKKK